MRYKPAAIIRCVHQGTVLMDGVKYIKGREEFNKSLKMVHTVFFLLRTEGKILVGKRVYGLQGV